jgi:hypothetical protein
MILFICVLRIVPPVCDFFPFPTTVPVDQFFFLSSLHPLAGLVCKLSPLFMPNDQLQFTFSMIGIKIRILFNFYKYLFFYSKNHVDEKKRDFFFSKQKRNA